MDNMTAHEDEMQQELEGVFSRQLCEELLLLLKGAYEGADGSVTVQTAPAQGAEAKPEPERADKWAGLAAGALLPGAACLICLLLGAVPLVTGAVTLACCLGEACAVGFALRPKGSAPAEETVAPPELRIAPEPELREAAWRCSCGELRRILKAVDSSEDLRGRGYDVTMDRRFGEWVQSFLMRTRDTQDRAMARLHDSLLDRLDSMRIHVYEELTLNSSGEPDVPFEDYLIDAREGEEYHEVLRPAVYSDRSLLARGKVK